ncbi:hypothetical protein [Natrinema soli]|uniref:DAGKc domain-containing protein n=1 Tax=Natrinema soli TaxID=1930624 RepID=A0ABD5SQM2_9EURY|nr:hypothetical protein [Natrinema soli]
MTSRDADSTDGATKETRRLILNPTSGDGDHAERVRQLAADHRFRIVETERAGHAVDLTARAAADDVDLLASVAAMEPSTKSFRDSSRPTHSRT